ncbi:DUF4123 domain-containing protein [Klebsiella michiganensis]|uniref:DUF4123 domain-containing protein n=1 Tax=Klebsiella michiganensis TaxID=1134687 RepID=UPI00117AC113|nr:DUF4123 domain-containing protein [Klebsiella michiganensis]TRW40963.1 DUF4123 domain-containing protein [Klebsiella michiganensis]TRW40983.1 DUF4123 domain-containing protein [Klebsiella michiganensis]
MITRYYRPEPLPLSAHQYLVIDRLSAGALPDTLPLTELVTPLTAPQAYLYPWLLSLNRLSVVEWVWLEKRFLLAATNGGHPPGCLLLTSHQSESVVKSHLINMLFISDEQRKWHMLRWFDPRVLFHLCWMMDARSLADMLHIRDIPDWTYWLNGRWHTLSFARNDEPDPAPPEAHRLFNQLQHVGLINDVLATLPDEADLSQREQLSLQIHHLAETGKNWLSHSRDLQAFVLHGIKKGPRFYESEMIQSLVKKEGKTPGVYYQVTRSWNDEQWQAVIQSVTRKEHKGYFA